MLLKANTNNDFLQNKIFLINFFVLLKKRLIYILIVYIFL